MNFAHCPLSSNKRTTKDALRNKGTGFLLKAVMPTSLYQGHLHMFSLNYKSVQMGPKAHLLHCLLLSDWKAECFFFFFVVYTVRMKLLPRKSWSQMHHHSPTCNKKPSAHEGDRFYILLLLSVSLSEVLPLCLNYDHGGVFLRLSF